MEKELVLAALLLLLLFFTGCVPFDDGNQAAPSVQIQRSANEISFQQCFDTCDKLIQNNKTNEFHVCVFEYEDACVEKVLNWNLTDLQDSPLNYCRSRSSIYDEMCGSQVEEKYQNHCFSICSDWKTANLSRRGFVE